MPMFCYTMIQPYAQMVVEGLKAYEFTPKRPGREKWGKKLGIHAAQTMASAYDVQKTIEIIEEHGPGVVGIKNKEGALKLLRHWLDDPKSFNQSRILGTVKMRVPVKVRDILKNGNPAGFDMDLWALPLINPKRLKISVPARGKSTIWWYEGTLRYGGKEGITSFDQPS